MLLRCPFCQTRNHKVRERMGKLAVECDFCGARGPAVLFREGSPAAERAWNKSYSTEQRTQSAIALGEIGA